MATGARSFKQAFGRGLIILFPTLITIYILMKLWELIEYTVGGFIHWTMGLLLDDVLHLNYQALLPEWLVTLIGICVAALLVFLVGLVMVSFVGRAILRSLDTMFTNLPIFNLVYPYTKQLTELFSEKTDQSFAEVVAVEYPSKGTYAIGFIAGNSIRDMAKFFGRNSKHVFVPNSPTPVTGYVIFVPNEEIYRLNMTTEEAVRFVVSGGVLIPPQQIVSTERKADGTMFMRLEPKTPPQS